MLPAEQSHAKKPGQEYYEAGKKCELSGDLEGAIKNYKIAERLGHDLEDDAPDRSASYCPPRYDVPRDPEDNDFVLSFSVDDAEGIKNFFDRFGFVVVRHVLTREECNATVAETWNYIEQRLWADPVSARRFADEPIDRNDPASWRDFTAWPPLQHEGILGHAIVFQRQVLRNRQNSNVHKVFSVLLETEQLMVNHDRLGFFRPTRDVTFPPRHGATEPTVKDMAQWKTQRNVHFDMNPWTYLLSTSSAESDELLSGLRYGYAAPGESERGSELDFVTENNEVGSIVNDGLHVQGLINLRDNRPSDGGFILVPGFKQHFREWAEGSIADLSQRYNPAQTFVVLPEDEPLQSLAVHITCRAGSLIVWDQRTAHGSTPNDSSNARVAQFIKMFPALSPSSERAVARSAVVRAKLRAIDGFMEHDLTELGARLFGLSPW